MFLGKIPGLTMRYSSVVEMLLFKNKVSAWTRLHARKEVVRCWSLLIRLLNQMPRIALSASRTRNGQFR